jgi:hypothetical protein
LANKVHTKSHVLLPANPASDQEVLHHTLTHSLTHDSLEQGNPTLLTTPFTFAHIRGLGDDTPTPPTLSRPPHHLSLPSPYLPPRSSPHRNLSPYNT